MGLVSSNFDNELIALSLKFTTNLYITIYVVENDVAKTRLIERFHVLLNKLDIQVVELDIVSADSDDINGPVVITDGGYYNEKPKWFKNSPFMLLIQNLENLSVQNPDHLIKLNKLALYLSPVPSTQTVLLPINLDKSSFMAAIIIESNLKSFGTIVRNLGSNAQQAMRAIKVKENSEGTVDP